MAYTAGAAQVPVTPDFRGFHRSIGAQLDKEDAAFARAGERWGRAASDGFKARFDAARMPTARIKTDADTAKANAEIDKAARNRKSKISIDVSWLKSPLALGAIGAAALGPQALGLGLAGAGLGAAFGAAAVASVAFGAVAKGAISKVTDAQKKLTAAQAQYAKATTKAGRASALKAEAAATAGLTASEKKLSTELTGLKSAWAGVQKAQEPVVTGALIPWFAAARTGLRFVSPLVVDAADSIKLLGNETNQALKSPFWDTFAAKVGILGTNSITNFGHAAGHVFDGLAHLFVTFEPDIAKLPPLVDKGAAAFDRWARSVRAGGLEDFFRKTFSHGNVATLKGDLRDLGTTLGNIATATAQISPAAFLGLSKVLEILSKLSPGQIEALALIYGAGKTAGGLGSLAGLLGGGKGAKGLGKLLTSGGKAGTVARGAGALGAALVVPQILQGTSSGKGGKNWWDNPFGMAGPQSKGSANNWLTSWAPYERFFTQTIPGWGRTAATGLAAGWNASASGVNAAFARTQGWITGQFRASGAWLQGAGASLAHGLGSGWNASAGWVAGQFGRARGWAQGTLSTAGSWLAWHGAAAARGLGNAWDRSGSWVAGQFGRARGWAQGALASAGGWLTGHGSAAARGFASGFSRAGSAVAHAAGAVYGWVAGPVRGAGGWLVGAGQAVMSGFLSGLQSYWGRITSFVSGIAGWVAAHKGPLDYDRKLLVPHGKATMAGYGQGLNAGFASVQRDVAGMAPRIAAKLNVPSVAIPSVPRLARGGDGLALNVTYAGPSNGAIAAIVKDLRYDIGDKSGGDVQRHLGQGKVRT